MHFAIHLPVPRNVDKVLRSGTQTVPDVWDRAVAFRLPAAAMDGAVWSVAVRSRPIPEVPLGEYRISCSVEKEKDTKEAKS